MSFQPVLAMSGYTGWRFLQRTMETQKEAFVESGPMSRKAEYFRANIASVRSAEALVADRRLLEVALGAFGLDDDIDNKFFIQKVLEEGTLDEKALASRLSDKRYAAFAKAFGFGDFDTPRTALSGFPDEILAKWNDRQFERAVGEQDDTMRHALNLGPALGDILEQSENPRAQWFAIMGNPPLRAVFEGALGFPSSFGRIDLDQQLEQFQDRARSVFGSDKPADFTDPEVQEKIIRLYLMRSELATKVTTGASIALTLLRGA